MTNLHTVFSNWGAPVAAGIVALTLVTSSTSAETSRVDTRSQKTERLTRSNNSAAADDALKQLRVRGGKMETRIQNGKLVLTGFAGAFGGGQVQLKGHMPVDQASEKSADLRFADVSVQKAGEIIGNDDLVAWLGDATLSGVVKGEWQGNGAAAIGLSANGSLAIAASKGTITDPQVLEKLGKLAGISDLQRLRFDSIKLKAHAENGKIVIDSAVVEGPDLTLAMAGNYVVAGDNLNLKIAMSVAPELAERSTYLKVKNVLDIFKSDNERPETSGEFVEVPVLLVSGDLKKPDVSLDKSKEKDKTGTATAKANDGTPANETASGLFATVKQLAKGTD